MPAGLSLFLSLQTLHRNQGVERNPEMMVSVQCKGLALEHSHGLVSKTKSGAHSHLPYVEDAPEDGPLQGSVRRVIDPQMN